MDLVSHQPYWLVKNGLVATYPALEHDERCDVLVLGAGITGAIFAERLAREGFDVVVLDRRDVGQGSTSASTALLLYEIDTHLADLRELVGRPAADRAYRLSVASIDSLERLARASEIDCAFRRKRSVYAASREEDLDALRRELEARLELGIDAAWLGPRELQEHYSLPYCGAIVSGHSASCDPYLLGHGLLKAAAARSTNLRPHRGRGVRRTTRRRSSRTDRARARRHGAARRDGDRLRIAAVFAREGREV
ncbi:MAG: FAD-dependent oxidoreductase [Pirellulales bacterium]